MRLSGVMVTHLTLHQKISGSIPFTQDSILRMRSTQDTFCPTRVSHDLPPHI